MSDRLTDTRPGEPAEQVDTYFSHPARDFAATDEALRIRSIDQENFVTYKGPKLDATTKTRREIDGLERKLGNEKFVERAPAAVVAENRSRLAAYREREARLEESLSRLD